MRQTHFTGNLDGDGNTKLFSFMKEEKKKKTVPDFSKETNKVL